MHNNNIIDNWFDFLLYIPTDQLKDICFMNKQIYNICSDNYFWYQKFNVNNLPIIHKCQNMTQWMKEYDKVSYSLKLVDNIINKFKNSQYVELSLCDYDLFALDAMTLINNIGIIAVQTLNIQNDYDLYKNDKVYGIDISKYRDLYQIAFLTFDKNDTPHVYNVTKPYNANFNQLKQFIFDISYQYCIKVNN